MEEIPKASIMQTGNQNQKVINDESSSEEFDLEPQFETPDFVKNALENGGEKDNEPRFEAPDFVENSMNNDSEKEPEKEQPRPRYNIISLFWLFNDNIWDQNYTLAEEESHMVIINHNIDFNNLKINLYKVPRHAIKGTCVFEQSLQRLISGCIYPSSCFRIIHEMDKLRKTLANVEEKPISVICMEQLIRETGQSWEKNRPMVELSIKSESILLTISDQKVKYWFKFKGWQLSSFLHSVNYVINKGFETHSIRTLNR